MAVPLISLIYFIAILLDLVSVAFLKLSLALVHLICISLLFIPLLGFLGAVCGSCNYSFMTETKWDCKQVLFMASF